jgi:uncharacterized integral membrane protein
MLRALVLVPILVVLVSFALSNPQPVELGLWPTDYTIEVPLSIAILSSSGLFFFLGAVFVWFGWVAARTRAVRARRRATSREARSKKSSVPPPSVGAGLRPSQSTPTLLVRK